MAQVSFGNRIILSFESSGHMPQASVSPSVPSSVPAELPPLHRRSWFVRLTILLAMTGLLFLTRTWWWRRPCLAVSRMKMESRDFASALSWLETSLWIAPEDGVSLFLRARICRKLGRLSETSAALQKARGLGFPEQSLQREQWLALAQSGQLRDAEPHLSELLTSPGGDGEEICEAFALGYIRTVRFAQATTLLEAWMKDWPERAQPWLMRGRIRALQQDRERAIDDFRQAMRLDPHNHEAALEYAETLRQSNQPLQAIPAYEACLETRNLDLPLRVRARVGLALCLKSTGQSDRVRPLLHEALRLAPDDPDALRETGRTELEDGQYDAAVRWLGKAHAAIPYDDECQYLLAQALQSAGREEEARPYFEFVKQARVAFRELDQLQARLSENPRNVADLVRAGELMLRYAPEGEGALRLLAALDLDPDHQHAHRLLAEYFQQQARMNPELQLKADEHARRLLALRAIHGDQETSMLPVDSDDKSPE